eukprot:750649-Hanusia_phi.AAC.10
MDEALRKIRHLIDHYDEVLSYCEQYVADSLHMQDPNSIQASHWSNRAVILLDECLLYIEESLMHCILAGPSDDQSLKNLDSLLNSSILHESLKRFMLPALSRKFESNFRRVADLRKNVKGASVELTSIQKMTTVISETYQSNLVETIQTSNHQISEIQKNLDKSTAHVAILQTLFGVHHLGFKRYFLSLTKNSLVKYNWVLRYDLNVPISQQKLKEMLAYKVQLTISDLLLLSVGCQYVDREVLERDDEGHVRKRVSYLEKDLLKWRGHPPHIELEYNESIHFLYKVLFLMNRDEAQLTAEDIHNIFVEDLALSK